MLNICNPCELATSATAFAIALAQDKSADEVEILAAYLNQVGDTLATLATAQAVCDGSADNIN